MKTKLVSIVACVVLFCLLVSSAAFMPGEKPVNKDYVGKYKLLMDARVIITVLEEDGKLLAQISMNGDAKYDLIPVKGKKETFDRMDNGKSGGKLLFHRDNKGVVTHLTLIEGGQFRADRIIE